MTNVSRYDRTNVRVFNVLYGNGWGNSLQAFLEWDDTGHPRDK